MIVVTDTSVALNLCHLRQERLLPALFGTVLAPPAVEAEFRKLARDDPRFRGLVFPLFIEIAAPMKIAAPLKGNARLHAGEIEALSLALETNAAAVLMDERAGRAAAAALGLRGIGVLGILIQAKLDGLIPRIGPFLDQLQQQAGFWIAPALRGKVLETAGE